MVDGLVGRGHVERRVGNEEVRRLHHETASVDRHDWEVFRAGQMGEAKSEPQDDIAVYNALLLFVSPGFDAVNAIRLVAVETASEHLVFVVRSDPQSLLCERSTLANNRVFAAEEGCNVVRSDLPTHRSLGVGMDTVLVDDLPEASSVKVEVSLAFVRILEDLGFIVEAVAVHVSGVSSRELAAVGVNLCDRVVGTVYHGVNTHSEEVLVVLSIDLGSNSDTVATRSLIFSKNNSVEIAGSLDLVLEGAILVKIVVKTVIIVGDGDELGNNQATRADSVSTAITVVGVLE